jgi:hypothetical protein
VNVADLGYFLSADEQLNGDDLLASLTTDEWALLDTDATG